MDIQDEEYIENAEENFVYKKRRHSITDIKKFIQEDDPLLQKRLKIKQQFFKNESNFKIISSCQSSFDKISLHHIKWHKKQIELLSYSRCPTLCKPSSNG